MAQDIDEPRDTARKTVHLPQSRGRKKRYFSSICGNAEPVTDIGCGVFDAQWPKMPAYGYALVELGKFWPGQNLTQLWLPGKNDVQQFFLFGLKVREETELFQDRRCQVLGFIDNHHHPSSRSLLGEKKTVEFVG